MTNKSRTIFVSDHCGAHEWAKEQGIDAEIVTHLDTAIISTGDMVIGTLPAQMIAEICSRGGRYKHLVIDLGPEDRGKNLSAREMERLGARLTEIFAEEVQDQRDNPDSMAAALQRTLRKSLSFRGVERGLKPVAWRFFVLLISATMLGVNAEFAVRVVVDSVDGVFGAEFDEFSVILMVGRLVAFFVVAFITIAIGIWAARELRDLVVVHASMEVIPRAQYRPRKVLILALSKLGPSGPDDGQHVNLDERLRRAREIIEEPLAAMSHYASQCGFDIIGASVKQLKTLDAECLQAKDGTGKERKRLAEELVGYRWTQNFRILARNADALEQVYVIGSEGLGGSAIQIRAFTAILNKAFEAERPHRPLPTIWRVDFLGRGEGCRIVPANESVLVDEGGVSFEEYDDIRDAFLGALNHALGDAHESGRYAKRDVCLEIGPGTKPVSIAGAVAALNKDVLMSYVGNDGEVRFHDPKLNAEFASELLQP